LPIKQQETLAKREARLRAAIAASANADSIHACAEQLRHSQLSILKARRELIRHKPESDALTRQLDGIATDEATWIAMPIDEILKRYRG
jgi:hypothetical protein